MATRAKHSPKEPKYPTAVFAMKYEDVLMRSERQAELARKMSDKARRMIDQAIEMRGKPLVVGVR